MRVGIQAHIYIVLAKVRDPIPTEHGVVGRIHRARWGDLQHRADTVLGGRRNLWRAYRLRCSIVPIERHGRGETPAWQVSSPFPNFGFSFCFRTSDTSKMTHAENKQIIFKCRTGYMPTVRCHICHSLKLHAICLQIAQLCAVRPAADGRLLVIAIHPDGMVPLLCYKNLRLRCSAEAADCLG